MAATPQAAGPPRSTPVVRVAGLILAGGLGRRLGSADKALMPLAGRPLLDHVLSRLAGQVERIVLNANGDPARFAAWGCPVVADAVPGALGPLAGVLAGLDWAAGEGGISHLASMPCDTPFLPHDLVRRLVEPVAAGRADLSVAASAGRAHPVVGLWPVALRQSLRHALLEEGARKVDAWTARYACAEIAFPAEPHDPFFNINRPEDLAAATRLLSPSPSEGERDAGP